MVKAFSEFFREQNVCEKASFYIFDLFSYVEWSTVDYLVPSSPQLAMFKYTW